MNLTDENVSLIQSLLEESPITRVEMKDNLIDHLCCAVENKMKTGIAFEKALASALIELVPNGFKEIEFETFILLNTKQITMKKLTYLTGLIFSLFASVGVLLKVLRYPPANELLILGFGGLAICFVPLLWVVRKPEKTPFERKRDNVALISLALLSIGSVLKTFHVVTANETLIIGTTVFVFGFLPMTF
ncbi:MAG: hypothetical protein HY015_06075 [Bacteroidetes bacterium]|nr:hypothetical protein [Bacteroidota bacterium]MBI3482530.1 hypothetical protein [Bacteroidota bacterium]